MASANFLDIIFFFFFFWGGGGGGRKNKREKMGRDYTYILFLAISLNFIKIGFVASFIGLVMMVH